MWETIDGPPPVDEVWNAICQAIHKCVEGAEDCKCGKMNQEIHVRSPGLWKMSEAIGRGDTYCDQTNENNIEIRNVVRHGLWNKHLRSPVMTLTRALSG